MNNYYGKYREEMFQFIPGSCKNFLEVGCGEGWFGEQIINRFNASVWGIEPNKEAGLLAEKKLTNFINAEFTSSLELPLNFFDCIIFNDVLEHLSDPWEALDYSKKLLSKDKPSYIIASVPNFRYIKNLYEIFFKKDFEYKDSGILDKTHLRFFTKKSTVRLFENLGFTVEKIIGINPTTKLSIKLLDLITFKQMNDMMYLQFAVVAKLY